MLKNLFNPDYIQSLIEKNNNLIELYSSKFTKLNNEITSILADSLNIETNQDKLIKTVRARSLCAIRKSYIEEYNNELENLYVETLFGQSMFGVRIQRSNNDLYHIVLKDASYGHVSAWLYDLVQGSGKLSDRYKILSASEALRLHKLGDYELSDTLLKKAKEVRSKELVEHQKSFAYTEMNGLSAVSKDSMWLYCNLHKLKKMYVEPNGEINISGKVARREGVAYIDETIYQYHPRHWMIAENGKYYPISHIRKHNMKVVVINDINMNTAAIPYEDLNGAFSRSKGWYNLDKLFNYRGRLYKVEDAVVLYDGRKVPSDIACFVERHNAWFMHREVVSTRGGELELSGECFEYDGEYYHKESSSFSTCGLCDHKAPSEVFTPIGDEVSGFGELVCSSCKDRSTRTLIRMCYSTDVLNVKGFGTTPLKINNEGVYVGLELETYADYNDENANRVLLGLNKLTASKQDHFIATRDGSLCGEQGVEYIFRPEGLNIQKRNVAEFVRNTEGLLAKDAGDGYGLHIHVSDHFLTRVDKLKIDNFVSLYEKYFRAIGKRDGTEYQRRKEIDRNAQLKYYKDGKYKMVNISRTGTVEYRFPKSLVDEVHINMNLELAQAVTMFCKYHFSNVLLNIKKCDGKALRDFINYVSDNKKIYPLLNAENNANINLSKLEKYNVKWKKPAKVTDIDQLASAA